MYHVLSKSDIFLGGKFAVSVLLVSSISTAHEKKFSEEKKTADWAWPAIFGPMDFLTNGQWAIGPSSRPGPMVMPRFEEEQQQYNYVNCLCMHLLP